MRTRLAEFRRDFADAVRACYGNRLVSLAVFGSWARDAATPVSDIDVLLVADPLPPGRGRRVAEFDPVDRATAPARARIWPPGSPPPVLSPVIKTPSEVHCGSPLFLDMTEACDLLADPKGFLRGYLAELRTRMDRLGTCRRAAQGGSYWDYRPTIRPGEVVEL